MLHPDSWNVYESLAESYMVAGDRQQGIRYYRRSVELNPNNQNAIDMLERLGDPR